MPSSCTVTETLNGEYEVTLVHPYDDAGKWTRLIPGCILRVPVPEAVTPYVKIPDQQITIDTSSRGVWRTTQYAAVRCKAGSKYKILTYLYGGTRIAVLGTENGWYKVTTPDGTSGYIYSGSASNVYKSSETKTILGDVVESKQLRDQPFRIYRVVPEMNQVTVYARHIFYDLLDGMVKSYAPSKGDPAYNALRGLGADTGFTFYSDIESTSETFSISNRNPVDAILGEDGFTDCYGGELMRDWFDVYVVKRVGEDSEMQIREGKNLTGLMYDVNTTDVVTRIMPTGETKDGKTLYLPELYIDSPNAGNYPHPKWIQLEVDDAKVGSGCTQKQAYEKMRAAAQAEFDKGCDMPTVTLTVTFVNLAETEDYTFLQSIFLGDSVRVISTRLGIDVSMRMTQYTYDCLLEKYTEMSLGTIADTISTNTITARQLPTGIISGSKLAIGSVGTGALQDGAVKTANIDVAAIETAHIQDAAISTAKIADLSVTSAKIVDGSIDSAKIAEAAIESAKIADAAITEAKISDASITTAKIADAAITKAKIANLSVETAHINDLAVTAAKIADAAITNAKIANAAIDTAQIALGAITSALIQSGAVGTAQIADASITEGKIVSLNADVITSGTLATERLIITGADGLIYEINATSSGLSLSELSDEKYQTHLNGSVIVARSITADQIAAATITANEILAGTITGDKIAAATIEGSNIKAGTITVSHVASNFGEELDLSSNKGIKLTVSAINDSIDEIRDEAVAQTQVLYTLGTSLAPSDDWSAVAPDWEDGRYMWQKTVITYISGDTEESAPTCLSGAAGEAASTLRIESSRGTVFKRDDISTVLSAVIYHGSQRITNITALRQTYGSSAYLQWKWRRRDDSGYGTISASDSRISDSGFSFTVTAADVDANVTFMCELITD